MLVDLDHESGAVRLDQAGLDSLLAAAGHDGHESRGGHPDAVLALGSGRLDAAMEAIARPLVTVDLTVAGIDTRLEHRAWLTPGAGALLLGVRPGLFQLTSFDPAFLTAALVRMTRMRPRRGTAPGRLLRFPVSRLPELVGSDDEPRRRALADAGADFAWHLTARWDGGDRDLTAVDGPRGLHLATAGALQATSNTRAYRILSTLLPTDAELSTV